MGKSEEEENELYMAYMIKLMRTIRRLHPQSCNDNCGCNPRIRPPPPKAPNEARMIECN